MSDHENFDDDEKSAENTEVVDETDELFSQSGIWNNKNFWIFQKLVPRMKNICAVKALQ